MKRCEHGVYWPDGHEKAFSCSFCNPAGNGDGANPSLMQRSPLRARGNSPVPVCPTCGTTATRSTCECITCGRVLTVYNDGPGGTRMRANRREPGECPQCGSRVHFEKDRKSWECADCGEVFDAARKGKIV